MQENAEKASSFRGGMNRIVRSATGRVNGASTVRYWTLCSSMDRWMVALDTTLWKARGRVREVGWARLEMVAVGP